MYVDQVAHGVEEVLLGCDDGVSEPLEERMGEFWLGHKVHQSLSHAANTEQLVEQVMAAGRHAEQGPIAAAGGKGISPIIDTGGRLW